MKKLNTSSIITVLFLVGILVMLNAIGVRYFVRTDLTSNKLYSLSDASKGIVENIEGKLIIKAYFSPDLPGQYAGQERYLRDMLEDYRAFSHGKLDYQFIDPGTEEKLAQEAQSFQIPPVQVQSMANDKYEVKLVYMGIAFIYGDKREAIPTITDTANLEYEVSSIIYRLTSPDQPVLGIASTGSQQQQASMQQLYEALGRVYDIRPVSLDEPISSVFDGVLVIAPRQPFTDWQLFNLDQFIMNGGKVGMFMNSYPPVLQVGQATPYNLNVNRLLNSYGIGLDNDLLMDTSANFVQVQSSQGFFNVRQQVKFVYLPVIQDFDRNNPITRDLQQVLTFFPSSVDTTLAAGMGYNIDVLMRTSPQSGRRTGNSIMIDPTERFTADDFPESGIPVAAIVSGTFQSAFAESGPPMMPPANGEGAPVPYTGDFKSAAVGENRILLVGDGLMVLDNFVQNPRDLNFALNASDWLLQSSDLIGIRSKEVPMVPLAQLPGFARNLVKWANRIGPMALVIILGIVLWQLRRRRNSKLASALQEGDRS